LELWHLRTEVFPFFAVAGIIIGADLVELNPDLDCQLMTTRVASKIMKEIASVIVRTSNM
jgi:arginase family enzyme